MNEEKSENLDQTSTSIQSSLFLHTTQLAKQTEKLNQLVSTSGLDNTVSQLIRQSVEANRLVSDSGITDAFKKFSEQTKEMSRLISASGLDNTVSQLARQFVGVNRLVSDSGITDAFKKFSEQTKEMSRLISASGLDSTVSQLARQSVEANRLVSASGIADIKSQLATTSSLARALNIESLTQLSLNRLKLEGLGKSFLIPKTVKASILANFNQFSNSYSSLVRSRDDISWGDLPRELTIEQPALEILESTIFLESISDPTLDEQFETEKDLSREEILAEIGGVEGLLLEIDKDLVTMWRGALEALESGHEDYARHCSVSLRELLTHVIHKLSPDVEVQRWATDPNLFYEGRPTRKARLLFVCRAVNHDVFADFINKDIAATIEFFTLFQRGTHQITIPYTHKQLLTLKNKVESTINFLIQTHRLNSQS